MKMPRKQIIIVDHGTYPFDVMICIESSHAEVVKHIEKKGYKLNEEEKEHLKMRGCGRSVMLQGGQTVIRLDRMSSIQKFHANLAHEIFHAVEFLFDRAGIKYNMEISGEVFAYQIAYLTGSIYEKLT